jgi:hypothetical protein
MTPDSHPSTPRHRLSPAAIAIVPVVVAVVLALFAWPSARLAPRDLPIGVAGAARAPPPQGARRAPRHPRDGAAPRRRRVRRPPLHR